jgi:formate dehydrogenase accessory protein FdhD
MSGSQECAAMAMEVRPTNRPARRRPEARPASSPLRAARTALESRTACKVTVAGATDAIDPVAAEVPVALVYHGRAHAVMMATPADLEDFARGFTLAEGIVAGPDAIGAVTVADMGLGYEIEIEVPEAAARLLEARRRGVVGGTACGLCGVLGLEQAMRPLPACTAAGPELTPAAIARAYDELPAWQPLHHRTGGMHAAALATPEGAVLLAREDVGRHNALDKLIGAASAAGLDPRGHMLALTSRCSAEMVQKAAHAGIAVIAAISAPTTLAIDLAARSGQTLLAFARGRGFTIYAHPRRIRLP